MNSILFVILCLLLVGCLPTFGWHHFGYYPSGGIGLVILILVLVALMENN